MRRIALLCLLLIGVNSASSATLSDLEAHLRSRVSEVDTAESWFSATDAKYWLNDALDRVNELTGAYEKSYDVTWTVSDSLGELLPTDFVREKGVMVWVSPMWLSVYPNPYWQALEPNSPLNADPQYFIDWTNTDSAKIYCRNMTQQVSKVRLFYIADVPNLDSLSAVCSLAARLHGYVIEEALSYYLESLKRFGEAQAIQAKIRQDMGIIKQAEVSK